MMEPLQMESEIIRIGCNVEMNSIALVLWAPTYFFF